MIRVSKLDKISIHFKYYLLNFFKIHVYVNFLKVFLVDFYN